jgi:WhiB family redox-sensing transcriptional regulator
VLDALLAALLWDELAQLDEREPWRLDAVCREHPELDFFPRRGQRIDPLRFVCGRCLVRQECAAFALEWDAQTLHGVWGGLSQRQRRDARRSAA